MQKKQEVVQFLPDNNENDPHAQPIISHLVMACSFSILAEISTIMSKMTKHVKKQEVVQFISDNNENDPYAQPIISHLVIVCSFSIFAEILTITVIREKNKKWSNLSRTTTKMILMHSQSYLI